MQRWIVAAAVLTLAFAIGASGLPGPLVTAALDLLSSQGFTAAPGPVADALAVAL